jgi:mevalonate kinase
MNRYYSHGKFLLTGEYLVLKGALALALPLRLGQTLTVAPLHGTALQWNAYQPDGQWFSVTLNPENLEIIDCDDQPKAEKLAEILKAVKRLNPKAFEGNGMRFTTRLDFNPNWGLGSSSTLIANLAQWADVNPYELLKLTFGGSGYDIACATAEQPIYYQLSPAKTALQPFDKLRDLQGSAKTQVIEPVETPTPMVEPVDFNPPFAEHLFFIYQGQKQSSSKEIKAFLEKANPVDLQKDIEAVSEISRSVPKCQNLDEFSLLMQCHERLIARCIGQEPVQKRFPDFEGTLKSLGAWGGDFILAATEWDKKKVKTYFKGKGLEVVFAYDEIVL